MQNEIAVYAAPLPFSNQQIKRLAKLGDTIEDIVNDICPDPIRRAGVGIIVMVHGDIIEPHRWHSIRPKLGQIVNVRVVPQGGGGGKKSPLAAILSIAVMIAAPYVGAALGSTLGFGGLWVGSTFFSSAAIYSAAFGIVGRLAINALAPPPKSSKGTPGQVSNPAESPTQFIEGAKNTLTPYGVVPICLGTNRMFPFQAALPYNETVGNDQYVRQLFTYGFGDEIVISDRKIGETPLSEFNNFEVQDRLNGNLHEGTSIYANDVFQEDFGILLSNAIGYQTRRTRGTPNEVIIDYTFPRGLCAFDAQTGRRYANSVWLEVQYAPAGTEDWSPAATSYKPFAGTNFTVESVITQGAEAGYYNFYETIAYRRDIVVLNPITGGIAFIKGANSSKTAEAAIATPVPDGTVRVATALVKTTARRQPEYKNITEIVSLSDDRQATLFGNQLQDYNSFVPSIVVRFVESGQGGSLLGQPANPQVSISGGGIKVSELLIVGDQTEAMRYPVRIVFPTAQSYDIRTRRITADTFSDQIFDEVYLTSIKSVSYRPPVTLQGINGTAMRMKGTDQLNGSVDQYNVLCSLVLPDFDITTGEWTPRISSNPASLYRYVLQCRANSRALPDNRIAIDDFEAWHTHCVEQGYTYNRMIDYATSLDEVLRDIAAAGSASPAIVDGKRTIVVDKIKDEIKQVITPRNSWGYSGELNYPELPHAFNVQFRNKLAGYAQDMRPVYADGYNENNATLIETLDWQSCDNSDLAHKHGRRHIAGVILQPETHSWMMDVENLVALRGDRVLLEHDVPIVGVGDARIKEIRGLTAPASVFNGPDNVIFGGNDVVHSAQAVVGVDNDDDNIFNGSDPVVTNMPDDEINAITSIVLDDVIVIPSVGNYYVRIRKADNSLIYQKIVGTVGENKELFFEEPIVSDNKPEVGDLLYVVESGGELDLIITRIEPMDDLTAKISALNYAPERFTAENSPIPPFKSNITVPLSLQRPFPPELIQAQSDETVMLRNADGSFTPRAVFTLRNRNSGDIFVQVKVRPTGTTLFNTANVLEATPERVILTGLDDKKDYDIHIWFGRAGGAMLSFPLQINKYKFLGTSSNPSAVQDFLIAVAGDTAHFKWSPNPEIDVISYRMKYSSVFSGATWNTSQIFEDRIFDNRLSAPFQAGTYLIKAVDINGNESETPTAIITYNPGLLPNVVATLDQHPDFDGEKDNVFYDAGNDSITIADIALGVGYYYFDEILVLDGLYTSKLSAQIVANGTFINNIFDFDDIFDEDDVFGGGTDNIFNETDVFSMDDIFGIGADKWDVGLEMRKIDTDPFANIMNGGDTVLNGADNVVYGGGGWGNWTPFIAGFHDFYGLDLRLRMESLSIEQGISPAVTQLSVTVDMPDRFEKGEDMTVPDTGVTVTYPVPFRAPPSVQITIQDGDADDEIQFINKDAGGFTFKVYNPTAITHVERTFDYISGGFGRKRNA